MDKLTKITFAGPRDVECQMYSIQPAGGPRALFFPPLEKSHTTYIGSKDRRQQCGVGHDQRIYLTQDPTHSLLVTHVSCWGPVELAASCHRVNDRLHVLGVPVIHIDGHVSNRKRELVQRSLCPRCGAHKRRPSPADQRQYFLQSQRVFCAS